MSVSRSNAEFGPSMNKAIELFLATTEHVSDCRRCAPLLKAVDSATPEEMEAKLRGLAETLHCPEGEALFKQYAELGPAVLAEELGA